MWSWFLDMASCSDEWTCDNDRLTAGICRVRCYSAHFTLWCAYVTYTDLLCHDDLPSLPTLAHPRRSQLGVSLLSRISLISVISPLDLTVAPVSPDVSFSHRRIDVACLCLAFLRLELCVCSVGDAAVTLKVASNSTNMSPSCPSRTVSFSVCRVAGFQWQLAHARHWTLQRINFKRNFFAIILPYVITLHVSTGLTGLRSTLILFYNSIYSIC